MITNEWIMGSSGAQDAFALRREVFAKEQGVQGIQDPDEFDAQSMQLILRDDDAPVATGRLFYDDKAFRISRLAVKKDCRGQGFGDLLIKLLLLKAFEFNPSKVIVIADVRAQKFYERYGFSVSGERVYPYGVESVPMAVTKETLVFKSKCGHDKTFWDFFEDPGK